MPARKLIVEWEPISDSKEIIAGFRGKSEVVVPAGLESTSTQLEKMKEYAKKPATELRKGWRPRNCV
jgi:isoquinoline 1-oxidoreductase beta subunit